MTGVFLKNPQKMGPIVIYNHLHIFGSEFKLDQQGLNEFVTQVING